MLRRDIADRLYSVVIRRFGTEQPKRELTKAEQDRIWYAIYGKLCHGESEAAVAEWCKTVTLN